MKPPKHFSLCMLFLHVFVLAGHAQAEPRPDTSQREKSVEPRKFASPGDATRVIPVADVEATVLFFLATKCPISNGYAPEINRICDRYGAKDVAFFIVYPDPRLKAEEARKHQTEFALSPLALLDPDQSLAKDCGATITPEAVVLSPEGAILYRGRIDNKYADLGKPRKIVTEHDLRDALDAILLDKPVPRPRTEAVGCYLLAPKTGKK